MYDGSTDSPYIFKNWLGIKDIATILYANLNPQE